jgi:hypothetical protein
MIAASITSIYTAAAIITSIDSIGGTLTRGDLLGAYSKSRIEDDPQTPQLLFV